MEYLEKAKEFYAVAVDCIEKKQYNSAANRLYYSIFIRAKGVLESARFDYSEFLKNAKIDNTYWNKKWRTDTDYSHRTMPYALGYFINRNGFTLINTTKLNLRELVGKWSHLKKFRTIADYKKDSVNQQQIQRCHEIYWKPLNLIIEKMEKNNL